MNQFRYFSAIFFLLFFTGTESYTQTLIAKKAAPTAIPSSLDSWRVLKQKVFPFYKVEILTKDNLNAPLGIEGTKAVISDLTGKQKVESKNFLIEPDPKINIEGWIPGTKLDLDKDGYEDLLLRVFSGGAHCCYNYEIYSLGKIFKIMGDLKLKDCGETIKLQDLNGDGIWEIVTCNASFNTFIGIPYSDSPFPPMIFGLENGKYVNQDKKYLQIFDQDIATEKNSLNEKGYSNGNVIQIVFDYLLTNRENDAWREFDQLYISPNKEAIRTEIQEKWRRYLGLPPESQPATQPTSPLSPESKPSSLPL